MVILILGWGNFYNGLLKLKNKTIDRGKNSRGMPR